jgi:multidrug efflux pump subunit AcrA (membrane-fusion protein)
MQIKVITILLFTATLFSCNKEKGTKPVVQDIKELVFASGTLEWDNSYKLTAQTDGVLSNIDFEIGDTVKNGKSISEN